MSDVHPVLDELTINGLHALLRKGELTSVQTVAWYQERIAAHNEAGAQLNAVVTVNPRARDDAAELDRSLAATGRLSGPLHGVPVLVKDQIETEGLRTTFGSIAFDGYMPDADATVVTLLKQAGAIVLAKTALCDFGAGWFSSSSITDHTKNPYAPSREAGGSSAGSAAGVAADLGLVGIGEDTGGSIRIPAAFTNLFGLRVTTGLISRAGVSPLVHFQDTAGPLARTVADLATVLDSIVGYDPADPFTVTASAAAPSTKGYVDALAAGVPLHTWRVGVLANAFGDDASPDAAPVNRVIEAAIARLEGLGVSVAHGLRIDGLTEWIADTSVYARQSKSDIDRFLSERPRAPVRSFRELYDSGRFHPLNDLFHVMADGPDSVEGDVEYLQKRLNQERFRRTVLTVFARHEIDFLIYPTVQVIPPTRDELAAHKYDTLSFPTNTVIASQAGLPALTIPAGFTGDGLPVGLELLATPLAEARMLQFAGAWEAAVRPRTPPRVY